MKPNLLTVFMEVHDELLYDFLFFSFRAFFANAKISKAIKTLVVPMFAILGVFQVNAETYYGCDDFEVEGLKYRLYYSHGTSNKRHWNACTVCGLSDKSLSKIVIPKEVEFKGRLYPVVSIGAAPDYDTFRNEKGIEKVVMSDNIYRIYNASFSGCTNLNEIDFGNAKIEEIESGAFSGCSELKKVHIPENCRLGLGLFSGCTSLEYIQLPSNMQSLPNGLFKDCKSLKSINIPKSVTEISNNVFDGCSSLTDVSIPNGVIKIGDEAFKGCSGILKLVIPESVESIGKKAFNSCSSLKSILLSDKVSVISDSMFGGCTSLLDMKLPNNLSLIGFCAFAGCTSLKNIDLPQTLTKIGESAFNHCGSLENITFPNSVSFIDAYAFSGCSSLHHVNVGSGLQSIGKYAFSGCKQLYELNLPECVSEIGEGAFSSSGMVSFVFPIEMTVVSSKMFEDCILLESVKFNEGLSVISDYSFSGCFSLNNISFPTSLEVIWNSAFKDCSGLSSCVVFPENMTNIYQEAFANCDKLKTIVIKSNNLRMARWIFPGCSLEEVIVLSDNVPIIEHNTFCSDYGFGIHDVNLFVKEEKKEEFISYGSDWSRFLGKKEMPTVQYKSAFYEYNGFDNEVKGCTADGKSELLFVFNSSFDNRTLNVSYYKDKGGPTSSWPLIEEYKL